MFILKSVEINIKTTNKKNKNMKDQATKVQSEFNYEVIRLTRKKQ